AEAPRVAANENRGSEKVNLLSPYWHTTCNMVLRRPLNNNRKPRVGGARTDNLNGPIGSQHEHSCGRRYCWCYSWCLGGRKRCSATARRQARPSPSSPTRCL